MLELPSPSKLRRRLPQPTGLQEVWRVGSGQWDKFDHIRLADDRIHRPGANSLVLWADVYAKLIQAGFIKIEHGLPVAQNTRSQTASLPLRCTEALFLLGLN